MSDPSRTKVIVVTGGRDYKDQATLDNVLNALQPTLVVQGGASGADAMAVQWAIDNEVWFETFEAEWEALGRGAGPVRNQKMLEAHINATVIAFPGNKGTKDCIKRAKSLGMVVLQVLE